MNTKETVDAVVKLILALPREQRQDACSEIESNGIFCWHCGFGEIETPRKRCYCCNDE